MSDALSLLAAPLIDDSGAASARPSVDAVLERPADPDHGDYATTLALRLAKPLRRAPREIAEELAAAARASEWVASADVAGPGFVNVRVSPGLVRRGRAQRPREPGFGGGTAAPPLRVNVEYVSANPTGRAAGLGRAATPPTATRSRACFAFAGHDVTREYYFNDSGAQIERFGLSLRARARGEPVPEDGYQGENLIALAQRDGAAARRVRRGVRARRREAHVRGHPRDARALPRAHGRVHERGRPAPLGRRRARARARRRGPGTSSRPRARRGCGRASSATTRTAC